MIRKIIRKIIGSIGYTLAIIGVGSMDSLSAVLPTALMAAGSAILIIVYREEMKWTEK